MTSATARGVSLSESLQSLVDSRLDTIDRILLGRVSRAERVAIVREVESQIGELLGEREVEDLTREDVLAVLARLDPPEAYLPDDLEHDARAAIRTSVARPLQPPPRRNNGVSRASGILGLVGLSLALMFVPMAGLIEGFGEAVAYLCAGLIATSTLVASLLAIVLGAHSWKTGPWAVVGVVTGILALAVTVLNAGLILMSV
jgi:hypothetical protein